MGAATSHPQMSRRRSRRRATRPMAEINVTPMVDVMLVLLVIFMVTAPLLTVGVEVDLPKTKAAAIQGQDEPLAITVGKDGQVYLQETALELETLVPRLQAITGNNREARIFIRGDNDINYGRVMKVIGIINSAGFSKVALVTSRTDTGGKPKKKKGSE